MSSQQSATDSKGKSGSKNKQNPKNQSNPNNKPTAKPETPNNALPQPALSSDAPPQPAPENETWHRGTGHIAPSSKPPVGGPNAQNAPEPSHAGEEPELIEMDKSELTPKVAPEELARRKVADAKKEQVKDQTSEQSRSEDKPSEQQRGAEQPKQDRQKEAQTKLDDRPPQKDGAPNQEAQKSDAPQQPSNASAPSASKPAEKTAAPPIEFVALSRSVHVHRPAPQHRTTKLRTEEPPLQPLDCSPQVVLIFGWMDAPLRLVSRYAAPYAALYPRATLVLKLSTGQSYMASAAARHAALQSVVKVLQEEGARENSIAELHDQYEERRENQGLLTMDTQKVREMEEQGRPKSSFTPPPKGMIIHSFSDGGASNLSQLLSMLPADVPAPRAVIFDSSPGKQTAWSGATAFTMPMAKSILLRAVVRSGLYAFLTFVLAFKRLFGMRTWSDLVRAALNSPKRWTPGLETRTIQGSGSNRKLDKTAKNGSAATDTSPEAAKLPPRLYLYSKIDELIEYEAVEAHAAECSKKLSAPQPKPQQIKKGSSAAPSEEEKKSGAKPPNVSAPVNLVRWDDAPHCGIARNDFKGYWSTVRSFLDAHII
ncbi:TRANSMEMBRANE PROTEIN 53 [Ceraceosorus bombacis]|uniref:TRANSMEMBRANE PROTEIN 53 n=1 Tax=Ceraceosorus bombacis TaxID=401625 RepID=A0A0P1BDG6_9BASI|nr:TRANSMEMBRANE PROTEIN 53 [Ceraceosorus bombacis]